MLAMFPSSELMRQPHHHQVTAEVLPAVKAYMENIAAVATTNHDTLDDLVSSNARLSSHIEKKHATIECLRK